MEISSHTVVGNGNAAELALLIGWKNFLGELFAKGGRYCDLGRGWRCSWHPSGMRPALFAGSGGGARGLALPPATDPLSLRDKRRGTAVPSGRVAVVGGFPRR